MQSVLQVPISRYEEGAAVDTMDQLAVEEPMELQLRYGPADSRTTRVVSVTMRTPGSDTELCAGFLYTEGILQRPAQIDTIREEAASANTVLVELVAGTEPVLHGAERNFYTTSSCGVCGKSGIEAIHTVSPFLPQPDHIKVAAGVFVRLPGLLRQQQAIFNSTGGLHASALFSFKGDFIMLREDVGRHNALDKLIGAAFLNRQLPLEQSILLLSGRASFELIQKAAMAGIKVVAAVGAPSSLAVQLATEQGITLLGFLRDGRFNIYSQGQRILL
jgi:FdhD protein